MNPSLEEQIACVEREIALRERLYPRWVVDGKMSQASADREIALMKAVRGTLVAAKSPSMFLDEPPNVRAE